MVLLWCRKIKLSKPYLGFVMQSRRVFFHHHHYQQILADSSSNTKILGQYRTVSSSVGQAAVTIQKFDSLSNRVISRNDVEVSLSDVSVGNAIIKMYTLSGSVDDALKVFDEMPEKDFESWCVMMKCFVDNGYGQEAMEFFTRFEEEGNKPSGEIFEHVFAACTLTGDVDEGLSQFVAMRGEYGIVPSMEHYHGVAKMLASSCYLEEALEFVERMPIEPSVDVWETLMNLSRVHGDLELGDRCSEFVEKLDPTRLDEVSSAGLVTKASDFVKEEPSYRYILCKFWRKDTHPEMDKIVEMQKILKSQMLEMGYVHDVRLHMHKGQMHIGEPVFVHNEELMVINEILNSKPRSTVRVINDVHIYVGCHNALKLMSEITGRGLIKRDPKRFHHFKNGACSCGDYW